MPNCKVAAGALGASLSQRLPPLEAESFKVRRELPTTLAADEAVGFRNPALTGDHGTLAAGALQLGRPSLPR